MRKRYEEIDIMRGLAIIAMIAIHTAAYFPRNPTVYALWDTLEFAVPIFIFCSAYLFFKLEYHSHIKHSLGYFKKRLVRLLIPYYAFLAVYIPVMTHIEPKKVTQSFIINNIFLTGGIDFNWMVLLFLLLSFLMPLLIFLFRKHRVFFGVYLTLALTSASVFLFIHPYSHYRLLMLLPWSVLIIFSWVVAEKEHSARWLTLLFAWSLVLFSITRAIVAVIPGGSVIHFHNKYPPNLYHLAYGFVSIVGMYCLARIFKRFHGLVRQPISFFSKYSYTIYFIHIGVIYFITVVLKTKVDQGSFPVFFAEVLALSAGIQLLLIGAQRFSTLKRGPTI